MCEIYKNGKPWLLWELWVYYEWKSFQILPSPLSTNNNSFVFALYVNILLDVCCEAEFVFFFKSTHLHGQTLHNIPRRPNFKFSSSKVYTHMYVQFNIMYTIYHLIFMRMLILYSVSIHYLYLKMRISFKPEIYWLYQVYYIL